MRLNFNDIRYIIQESYRRVLLTEISNNAIETMIKRYNSDIGEVMNMTLGELEERQISYLFDINDDDIKSSPMMKMKDYVRLRVMREFNINRGNGPIKYMRGIIRICFDESNGIDFMSSLVDVNKLKKFKQIVGYIYSNGLDFDEDLNGMNFVQLNRVVGSKMRIGAYRKWLENGKNEYGEGGNRFGDYTVVKIDSHNDAARYSEYTSWCVTQRQSWYDDYAGDGSQFYFCLKDGFENVKKIVGEGCPLDEYGLSMVSVCIRPNGEPKHITTRWNHNNSGEDNSKLNTLEKVEKVLGIPKTTFLQHNAHPELDFEDVNDVLEDDYLSLDDIFQIVKPTSEENVFMVYLNNKWNLVNNRRVVSDKWYNSIDDFNNGYVKVFANNMETVMKYNGEMPLQKYYDRIVYYDGKIGVVIDEEERGNWFYLIDSNGNFKNDEKYDWFVKGFPDRLHLVTDEWDEDTEKRWHVILNSNGEILPPGKFLIINTNYYDEDFVKTESGEYYVLMPNNLQFRKLSESEIIEHTMSHEENIYFSFIGVDVYMELGTGNFFFVDSDSNEVVGKNIRSYESINNKRQETKFIKICKNGKYGFITEYYSTDDNDEWFDDVLLVRDDSDGYDEAIIGCVRNNKIYAYSENGTLVSKYGFDKIDTEYDDFVEGTKVYRGKYINFIDWDNNLKFKEWVNDVLDETLTDKSYGKLFVVEKHGKYNIFGDGGKPISSEWFDDIKIENDYVEVVFEGEEYEFNIDEGVIINLDTEEEIPVIEY